MAQPMLTRRQFATLAASGVAAAAASGPPVELRASAAQVGTASPVRSSDDRGSDRELRLVGAFGYRKQRQALVGYGIPGHEPILLVHAGSDLGAGAAYFSDVAATTLGPIHPYFAAAATLQTLFKALCLAPWDLAVGSAGEAVVATPDLWPRMQDVAAMANPGVDYRFHAAHRRVVTLFDGRLREAPPTGAAGGDRGYTFWLPTGPIGGPRRLTDIGAFEHAAPLGLRLQGGAGRFVVTPAAGTPAWVVALPAYPPTNPQPHILRHGDHYFDFFQTASGDPVKYRPLAMTEEYDADPAVEVSIPCKGLVGASAGAGQPRLLSPPDSEFCYQAAF
ncbi:MAG: hypothetical protein AB7H93_10370 [Vicinamibacterales bacterium]